MDSGTLSSILEEIEQMLFYQRQKLEARSEFGGRSELLDQWCELTETLHTSLQPYAGWFAAPARAGLQEFNAHANLTSALANLTSYYQQIRSNRGSAAQKKAAIKLIDTAQQTLAVLMKHVSRSMVLNPGTASGTGLATGERLDYDETKQPWYEQELPLLHDISSTEALALEPRIDVLLMTVTNTEFKAVMRLVKPLPEGQAILCASVAQQTYYLGRLGTHTIVLTRSRMGGTQQGSASMAFTTACTLWKPRAVIMVGIAFGVANNRQQIADVLVSSEIIPYEPQKWDEVGDKERGQRLVSHTSLRNRFENVYNWKFVRPDQRTCNIYVGPILSGEKLVNHPHRKAELLRRFPDAIGGEMEGAALSAAAAYNNTPWILVKAICDWADGTKNDQYQSLAAAAAADLVHHILERPSALDGLDKPA